MVPLIPLLNSANECNNYEVLVVVISVAKADQAGDKAPAAGDRVSHKLIVRIVTHINDRYS